MSRFHIAQVNIGRIRGELDGPIMVGFVNRLQEINALADSSPGFVWRLQDGAGDATYLRPYDEAALLASAQKTGRVLTIEEHSVVGGLGTIVAETVARAGLSVRLDQVALPDQDLEVGVPAELYEYYGLTPANVAAKARNLVRR